MRKRIRACGIAAALAATAGTPAALAQGPIKIGAFGPMTGGAVRARARGSTSSSRR